MQLLPFGLASTLFLAAACATGKPRPTADDLSPVAQFDAPAPTMHFTGKFIPVIGITSGSAMSTGSNRITGSVQITSEPGSDDRFSVLTEFTSDRGAETLWWSIVDGPCGSGSIPLVPPRQLAEIDVPGSGQVRVRAPFRATMVTRQTYHLNLYLAGGADLSSVIGCANLKG